MLSTAYILAGGLGTRLRSRVATLPKVLAPVRDRPFLHYLLDYLSDHGVRKVVICAGYKSDILVSTMGNSYGEIELSYSFEQSPIGTGGAISKAFRSYPPTEPTLVCNGDTLFAVELAELSRFAASQNADAVFALAELSDVSRYSPVTLKHDGQLLSLGTPPSDHSFTMKAAGGEMVNGGVMWVGLTLARDLSSDMNANGSSLESLISRRLGHSSFRILGMLSRGFFLDIGVPDDYEKAQELI